MGKTCAFLGNDYDKFWNVKLEHDMPSGLKEKIKEQIINLIENEGVYTFFVGEIGGYEKDAYDVVLEVKKEYPQIRVILVVSNMAKLNEVGGDGSCYIVHRRDFDDFILPDRCGSGYKKLCIVYRNRFIIENTDFIIAYNQRQGRAYEFCKAAKGKCVKVIELAEKRTS